MLYVLNGKAKKCENKSQNRNVYQQMNEWTSNWTKYSNNNSNEKKSVSKWMKERTNERMNARLGAYGYIVQCSSRLTMHADNVLSHRLDRMIDAMAFVVSLTNLKISERLL